MEQTSATFPCQCRLERKKEAILRALGFMKCEAKLIVEEHPSGWWPVMVDEVGPYYVKRSSETWERLK